jgi:hypothetical protein
MAAIVNSQPQSRPWAAPRRHIKRRSYFSGHCCGTLRIFATS